MADTDAHSLIPYSWNILQPNKFRIAEHCTKIIRTKVFEVQKLSFMKKLRKRKFDVHVRYYSHIHPCAVVLSRRVKRYIDEFVQLF